MDPVRHLIVQKAHELGGLKRLSTALGKNHAYLQQFVHRGVPAQLPEAVRHALAGLLSVEEATLRLGGGLAPAPAPLTPKTPRGNSSGRQPVQLAGTIPVYGQAVGGRDGKFILNGNKIADILAPPKLSGVPDAYAVYVVGDSMAPRYFSGEAVFVNPRMPIRPGDFVVVQIAADEGEPPEAYVKRYVSRDDKILKLEQFNPKKTLQFPRSRVVTLHRIIMGGDG
jgi:phage repressor protein C with HTH and peptisase S24 domain